MRKFALNVHRCNSNEKRIKDIICSKKRILDDKIKKDFMIFFECAV